MDWKNDVPTLQRKYAPTTVPYKEEELEYFFP